MAGNPVGAVSVCILVAEPNVLGNAGPRVIDRPSGRFRKPKTVLVCAERTKRQWGYPRLTDIAYAACAAVVSRCSKATGVMLPSAEWRRRRLYMVSIQALTPRIAASRLVNWWRW